MKVTNSGRDTQQNAVKKDLGYVSELVDGDLNVKGNGYRNIGGKGTNPLNN